jgi:Pectate lyase superfamily protein
MHVNGSVVSVRRKGLRGKFLFAVVTLAVSFPCLCLAVWDIPADRRTAWFPAGLDVAGGLPNYPSVTCNGLDPSGVTNNTSQIQTCVTNAASGTAVFIPAGTYLVSGTINMKSNVVLRGAGAVRPWLPTASPASTTLKIGGTIIFNGGSKSSNWTPAAPNGTTITAGYTAGSTSITVSSATSYNVNDYIAIYQNKDSAIIDDKNLGYLGEDFGSGDVHVKQQYSKITAKSGNTLTIDPPIYFVTPTPVNPSIRKQTFGIAMAGLENLKLSGNGTNIKLIEFHFTRNCWVKGIETYNVGQNGSGSPHIWTDFSYGNEYRDSYFHHGVSNDSGRNYGIEFYNWNSRHKVENNIVRDTRHSIIFEGGGSGNVILYNYTDDNWESVQGSGATYDSGFLSEDQVPNHGAHPHMNLWEGNSASSFWGDYTQGSSSHNTLFRNYVRCKQTTLVMSSNPWDWVCIEIEQFNRFYTLAGNVIGLPSFTGGTVLVNSSASPAKPIIYRFGYSSNGGSYSDTQSFSTVLRHGNYNYVSDGVDNWADPDHVLPSSMYYTSKPLFFGGCAWPPVGPDLNPLVGTLPAKDRYDGGSACVGGTLPSKPNNFRISG